MEGSGDLASATHITTSQLCLAIKQHPINGAAVKAADFLLALSEIGALWKPIEMCITLCTCCPNAYHRMNSAIAQQVKGEGTWPLAYASTMPRMLT